MVDINKVGGLWVREKRLLVVKKKGLEALISLGGKVEPGETELDCLDRECLEETGRKARVIGYFGAFEGRTIDQAKTIKQSCYLIELDGEPVVNSKDSIEGFAWIERDYASKGILLAPQLEKQIVPALIERGYL